MTVGTPAFPNRPQASTVRSIAADRAVAVEVLVCGSPGRGDDGAPIAAAALIRDRLPIDGRLRIVGQLDVDDLLRVPSGAAVVIVDAAKGIRPGRIIELPLDGLLSRDDRLRTRSSHALAVPEVIAVADLIRGRPLRGRIVVIGGAEFGLGAPLSGLIAEAVPALVTAVLVAINRDRA
jgi:hydrogenase maturation protease